MHQSCEDLLRPFIAHDKPAEGLPPTVAALDAPSALGPPHLSSLLLGRHPVIRSCRYDWLAASLHTQRPPGVAGIASVADQPRRLAALPCAGPHFDALERRCDARHRRWGSRLQVYSARSPRAIGQYHTLCSLATFRLPDQRTPCFARLHIPSMQHSSQRTFCWSESWWRTARHRCKSRAVSAHSFRRRWTALCAPYLAGSALQGAPVHKLQRRPSKPWRSSRGGRPPGRLRRR
jgi:hypothetical protein